MAIDFTNPEGGGAGRFHSAPSPLASSPHAHERGAREECTHPADRPAEPEHPMMLNGQIVPGDVEIMARCLFEELLQVGVSPEELVALSHDPTYQALYSMRVQLGEGLDAILDRTVQRVGRHRHRTIEHTGDVQAVSLTVNAAGR